jgi:hypothetical protein
MIRRPNIAATPKQLDIVEGTNGAPNAAHQGGEA